MTRLQRLRTYFVNSYQELRRVIWPTRQQALTLSGLVLAFTVAIAVYLSVFDLIFRNALERLLLLRT